MWKVGMGSAEKQDDTMIQVTRGETAQEVFAENPVSGTLERVDSCLQNFFDHAGEIAGGDVLQGKHFCEDLESEDRDFERPVVLRGTGGESQPGCVLEGKLVAEGLDRAFPEAECGQAIAMPVEACDEQGGGKTSTVKTNTRIVKQDFDPIGFPADGAFGSVDCRSAGSVQSQGLLDSEQAFHETEGLLDGVTEQVLSAEKVSKDTVMVAQADFEDDACTPTHLPENMVVVKQELEQEVAGVSANGPEVVAVGTEVAGHQNNVVAQDRSLEEFQKELDFHGDVVDDNSVLEPATGHDRLSSLNADVAAVERLDSDAEHGETPAEGGHSDVREILNIRALPLAASGPSQTDPGSTSAILDAAFLARKGYFCSDDDENDSEGEESESEEIESDESEDASDHDTTDQMSAFGDLGEGDEVKKKKLPDSEHQRQQPHDSEDSRPVLSKNETDVLPLVPEVTAVLGPHHKIVAMGHISSVLDLKVIVAASSSAARVLDEGSVLWLTESRTPLGVVDEIFGPVKDPFYVVRYNKVSDIPGDAQAGVSVSYVDEFAEFIMKEKPSLYKKAVDASGLDDEEIASDEDLEFSDDEKEAAARFGEKSKRSLDGKQDRPSHGCDLREGQRSQRQGRGVARGHRRRGGRGVAQSNGRDFAADFGAGMDLQASQPPLGSVRNQRNGGNQNHERWNSSRGLEDHEMRHRPWGAGPAISFDIGPQPQYFHQNSNGPRYPIQANSQAGSPGQPAYQVPPRQNFPSNPGAGPAHLSHDAQDFGMHALHPCPGVPQPFQIPRAFIPGQQFNPFNTIQGSPMMRFPGYVPNVPQAQMTYGVPMHGPIGDMQAGRLGSNHVFSSPSHFGNGTIEPTFRAQAPPPTGHSQGHRDSRHIYNGPEKTPPWHHQRRGQS